MGFKLRGGVGGVGLEFFIFIGDVFGFFGIIFLGK